MTYDLLFQPICIGACRIKNRFAMAPLGPLGLSDAGGGWSRRGIEYYAARARGGVGLIHTGITYVDNTVERHAVGACPCSTYDPTHFISTSTELTERIHAYGTKIFLQMTGGFGRVNMPKPSGFFSPVAPSAIQHRWEDVDCRALTLEEIRTLVLKFGEGAYYAKAAGFDGIQIHAVHEGYLLDQFAIPLFNRRTDAYGGSLENRLRIVREIREEIALRCGADFPVTIRYSLKSFIKGLRRGALPGEDFEELGRDIPEGLEAARLLASCGYAALDVDVGSYDAWWWSHPPMYQEKGLYLPYAKLVKEVVDIPVLCAGRMDDPELAVSALRSEACDIISLGRPLLADADYVTKLRAGKADAIRPCLSCQEGCMGRIGAVSLLNCAVNPACCRESDLALTPAPQKKRVLVVGGGPAGCEAARVLALRGHSPILFESGPRLGGNLLAGGVPDFKKDDLALARWYAHTLRSLPVEIHLNCSASSDTPAAVGADAVIIAPGGMPKIPDPFRDAPIACTAADALLGKAALGARVVILGSGTVACETALWCRRQGKEVTLLARSERLLLHSHPLCRANRDMLESLIPYEGIQVITCVQVLGVDGASVVIRTPAREQRVACDRLILAVGYRPDRTLYDNLADSTQERFLVGDANRVANIMYAVWDAYEVARTL